MEPPRPGKEPTSPSKTSLLRRNLKTIHFSSHNTQRVPARICSSQSFIAIADAPRLVLQNMLRQLPQIGAEKSGRVGDL